MIITEDEIIKKITEFFWECDADELARQTGELFGGKCFPVFNMSQNRMDYEFTPDENYCGAFIEDDDDDYFSHRRNASYCAKCGGDCQYDDNGNLIEGEI